MVGIAVVTFGEVTAAELGFGGVTCGGVTTGALGLGGVTCAGALTDGAAGSGALTCGGPPTGAHELVGGKQLKPCAGGWPCRFGGPCDVTGVLYSGGIVTGVFTGVRRPSGPYVCMVQQLGSSRGLSRQSFLPVPPQTGMGCCFGG